MVVRAGALQTCPAFITTTALCCRDLTRKMLEQRTANIVHIGGEQDAATSLAVRVCRMHCGRTGMDLPAYCAAPWKKGTAHARLHNWLPQVGRCASA